MTYLEKKAIRDKCDHVNKGARTYCSNTIRLIWKSKKIIYRQIRNASVTFNFT